MRLQVSSDFITDVETVNMSIQFTQFECASHESSKMVALVCNTIAVADNHFVSNYQSCSTLYTVVHATYPMYTPQ